MQCVIYPHIVQIRNETCAPNKTYKVRYKRWGFKMAALVQAYSGSKSQILAVGLALFLGFSIVFVTGHVQSHTLHDAAHDVRHATGFPCH